MYRYYQKIGGSETWVAVHAEEDLSALKPTFITVLALDVMPPEDASRELTEKIRYQGPLYFDLDNEDDVGSTIVSARELVAKLIENGCQPTDLQIFLSGKKGLHVLVPQVVFMERHAPLQKLPAIYKELAFTFAVADTDFKVYTARKGRMLRTCYNVRENGNYKVPITFQELEDLTPEIYSTLCKSPRTVPYTEAQYRAKFALVFDAARQKVTKHKPRKHKPIDASTLLKHKPVVQQLMNGEAIDGSGFNKIAIQLALYARETGLTPDQLVDSCAKLLDNHSSDGNRYGSRSKRERELRRMCAYVEDNPAYEYAIEPIKAMLPRSEEQHAADLEQQVGGVILRDGAYWLVGNGDISDKLLLDCCFTDAVALHDRAQGSIACLVAKIHIPGKEPRKLSIERNDFISSSSLHRLTSAYGVSFMGTDINARGIYEIMLRNIEPNKYVTECEGLDVISIPSSPFEEARKPFLVWADNKGVRLPQHIIDLGISIQFQGWPEPDGVCKTDLTNAPPLRVWLAEPGNKDRLGLALKNLFKCHPADVLGKSIGWMVACFWRQMFNELYNQFPLLHVNGIAGSGKTKLVQSLSSFFYYQQTPVRLTPSSTPFSILSTIAGSASIPVIVDEYKPTEMTREIHSKLKAYFRDAYNKTSSTRGGGTRTKDSFGALNTTQLAAPVAFISEAMESSEPALMERVVLVTIKRQPTAIGSRNFGYFMQFWENRNVLSILGHNLAAHITKHGDFETFKAEFDAIYNEARSEYLPRPGDEDILNEDQLTKRSNAKERLVFNNSVAAFGLKKFTQLIQAIFGDEYEIEFGAKLAEFKEKIFNRMDDAVRASMPEYLKVLVVMSDMTRLPPENQHALVSGTEYQLSEEGGLPTLHLAPRICYAKYRSWLRTQGQVPLFQDDRSFVHSLQDAPQFYAAGSGTSKLKVDTIVLDYNSLVRTGVSTFVGKPVAM